MNTPPMNPPSVLCVDDEPQILEALERTMGEWATVHTACGAEAAIAWLNSCPVPDLPSVIISDMRMPGMDGATFFAWVREHFPDTQRILLTGQADLASAVAAVNEGQVFRFLTKPCPPAQLKKAVEAGWEQHRLIRAERDLLERTVAGSIQMLTDALAATAPYLFLRSAALKRLVHALAREVGLRNTWELEAAAALATVGCLALPQEIVERRMNLQALTPEEQRQWDEHPHVGYRLIHHVPRLEGVALLVRCQELKVLPEAMPRGLQRQAEVLRVALEAERLMASGRDLGTVVMELRGRHPDAVLDVLKQLKLVDGATQPAALPVRQLRVKMVLEDDVRTRSGMVIMQRGHEITAPVLERLRRFAEGMGVMEPVRVLIPG